MQEEQHPLRVCLLTGGGDAPGLNAAVRAFVHVATRRNVLVYASRYGFDGLLGREQVAPIHIDDVRGILSRGGSILGCSTTSNPFALPDDHPAAIDAIARLRVRLKELGIDALVLAGGDGTMTIAARLEALGVRCVGIPKTIDGDLGGTEESCGIDTAVETATRSIDALHSTAEAHQRVMIVEVMGRDSGWIALRSGIAGGADVVLIPEVPYDAARVVAKIRERESLGLRFSIVVVGEGAAPIGDAESEVEPKRPGHEARLGGAGELLAKRLRDLDVRHEVRVTVLGHLQRGGTPTAFDRLLATRFAAHAARLCAEREFGRMVSLRNGHVISVSIADALRSSSRVDPSGELARCARAMGIELGAE
jgi:ATP-dependent phosphofructokinase / diphosphate-dependent phosphofructokinase